jgi:hypothetical protein
MTSSLTSLEHLCSKKWALEHLLLSCMHFGVKIVIMPCQEKNSVLYVDYTADVSVMCFVLILHCVCMWVQVDGMS